VVEFDLLDGTFRWFRRGLLSATAGVVKFHEIRTRDGYSRSAATAHNYAGPAPTSGEIPLNEHIPAGREGADAVRSR